MTTNKQELKENKLNDLLKPVAEEGIRVYPGGDRIFNLDVAKKAMEEYASYVLQEEMDGLRKSIEELPEKLGVQPMQIGWWYEVLDNVLSLIPRNENE